MKLRFLLSLTINESLRELSRYSRSVREVIISVQEAIIQNHGDKGRLLVIQDSLVFTFSVFINSVAEMKTDAASEKLIVATLNHFESIDETASFVKRKHIICK